MVGKGPWCRWRGDGVGYLMQAMCCCSGPGGPCASGPREGYLKFLRFGWWYTPLEGLKFWNSCSPYLIASRFFNFYRHSGAKLLVLHCNLRRDS